MIEENRTEDRGERKERKIKRMEEERRGRRNRSEEYSIIYNNSNIQYNTIRQHQHETQITRTQTR